jgi:hypothetical protein
MVSAGPGHLLANGRADTGSWGKVCAEWHASSDAADPLPAVDSAAEWS